MNAKKTTIETKNASARVDYPPDWQALRTALSHDWLTGMRGGEKVLELLCDGFPGAPVYSLIYNRGAVSPAINAHPVRTSWIQHLPGRFRYYRYLLPLFPMAISGFRLPESDLVISTSHCVAKGVRPPRGARHLCYCFTPMRYAWIFYDEYFGGNPLKKLLLKPVLHALRAWDKAASNRVDMFVAISRHVRERIRRCYDREAKVIYPPVDTRFYTPGEKAIGAYDLVVSALVPYKRVDLAIRAANQTGFPLKIVGVGTEFGALKALAGPHVEMLGFQSNEAIREWYRGCRCLLFPGEEDFGIVPVEAQACGKPVVAFAKGGALETIEEGLSGVFFEEQTTEAIIAAIERCVAINWDADAISAHAEPFGAQRFIDEMDGALRELLEGEALGS